MRWLPLLFVFLVACAPVRTVDDDDAAGLVCPGGNCAVAVSGGVIACGEGGSGIEQLRVEDGSVEVFHAGVSDGCCPEYEITAELDPDAGQLVVDYGVANDFCDCICRLDAQFTLVDVPYGWILVLPGAEPMPLAD